MSRHRLIMLAVVAVLLNGCGSARRGESVRAVPVLDTSVELHGQQVFMRHCTQCHNGGAGSLGPAINDKPLPGFMIRLQVRHGFGAMPSFSKEKISDAELDDLVAYLRALRRAGTQEGSAPRGPGA